MPTNTALINGRSYDWAQIVVNILGVPLVGISSISYKQEQEKINNYGAGKLPVSRGHGVVETSVSLEIHMNDIEQLRLAAPNGNLLEIPAFDITVSYLNDNLPVNHTLKNCEFTVDGVEGSQGDTQLKMSYDLACSHILYA